MQGIAPGLNATQPAMRFLIHPALEEDRRGAGKRLPAPGAVIAAAVITAFGQQARSETFASSRQGLEELAVGMLQKKAFDLLVVIRDLFYQRFKLVEQCHHQSRFGARDGLTRLQTRLLKGLCQCLGFLSGSRIPGLFEQGSQFLHRGQASSLQGWIGTQEGEGTGLLQLAEQVQCDRVVRYASGGELVDQPSLHLYQAILITRQHFEFLDLVAIRVEPSQILEVGSPRFGKPSRHR
jgi:hypothetical protein